MATVRVPLARPGVFLQQEQLGMKGPGLELESSFAVAPQPVARRAFAPVARVELEQEQGVAGAWASASLTCLRDQLVGAQWAG